MKRMDARDVPIYQLEVSLRAIRPPIWRRFAVPSDIRLKSLHEILQFVMGWTDSHLHQFEAGGEIFGPPDRSAESTNESTTPLNRVLRRPKDKMTYEYDFGDSWIHDIVLEKVLPPLPGGRFPILLAGARACPPEDVGGPPVYAHFLAVRANPKHPEHRDLLEWAGGSFDPEAYDVGQSDPWLPGL